MKTYSALVKSSYGNGISFIENKEYETKARFIKDLRGNGYKVNPAKVKESNVFDYICKYTNMAPWDWDVKEVPEGY